jgi:hypothetical protein
VATNKRLTNLSDYKSVLPYSSELFGIYQPMIGWKSKRAKEWMSRAAKRTDVSLIDRLSPYFQNRSMIEVNADCVVKAEGLEPADYRGPRLIEHNSVLLNEVRKSLAESPNIPDDDGWHRQIDQNTLSALLSGPVKSFYNDLAIANCRRISGQARAGHADMERARRENALSIERALGSECEIAGALLKLLEVQRTDLLLRIFYEVPDPDGKSGFSHALKEMDTAFDDPFLTFDPKRDVGDVTVSPIGVTHLFRQYFFELDTFLGTPVGHVWLSPGSTVELVEVSTRKTIVEKTVEQSFESIQKSEKSTTDADEISEAVKQDNKEDLKLGISTTVNQSWGTGNVSATASLNLDKSQQTARETAHKRMRQQTEKLSSEIRQNYKSTFKTITETGDLVSKRYVLANNTPSLINYELRRKMRQVAVQVQDIGTYLSWDTFVDEPGVDIGLANLVHLAQPTDLLPVPDQTKIDYPADQVISFRANATWDWGDSRRYGFVPLTLIDAPPAPEGYDVVIEPGPIPVAQISGSGEDFNGTWGFEGRFMPTGQISLGVVTSSGGLEWDERVDFILGGAVRYRATAAKRAEIDTANAARSAATNAASAENDRKTREAFIKAAKDRIEIARAITRRKYEDLRDEERIIVYRRLIRALMTDNRYKSVDDRSRHVLSQLINTIFDIDKMLYFVAPEWWKPRRHVRLGLSINDLNSLLDESVVSWADGSPRPDNYLITEKSMPAAKGSSLGWLLQLDGDDMRNAFLNAPWVKAVIPVRPGREQAAINWLKNAGVEGSDGLMALYAAPADELQAIRDGLGFPAGHAVTLQDAINHLCKLVTEKHSESNAVKSFPETEINDDNKVLATPIEKVYEHGFYPLQGGFRIDPAGANPDPNNKNRNFQVFDQWIEILPTDQVVPVEVAYDPKTGRQT